MFHAADSLTEAGVGVGYVQYIQIVDGPRVVAPACTLTLWSQWPCWICTVHPGSGWTLCCNTSMKRVIERWQPVIGQCGHKDTISLVHRRVHERSYGHKVTISLVHRRAHEPSLELTDRSPAPGGLEWLVGAAVSLSLRAVSCLSCAREGSWAACHTNRRAPELLVISTIVVLSCCHAHGRAPELLGIRTIGILSAPACAPEGCWVHLRKYHYDTTTGAQHRNQAKEKRSEERRSIITTLTRVWPG